MLPGSEFKSFFTVDRGQLKKVAHAVGGISLKYYLIALGSGKALRFIWQLSGDGTISEQCIFSGSLRYGTPHTW